MKKDILALMVYVVLFALVFLLSVFDYLNSIPIFNIGLPALTIDLIVAFLSLIGLIKSMLHIVKY